MTIHKLEHKIGTEKTIEILQEIVHNHKINKRITAIKILRTVTNWSLKDAKEYTDWCYDVYDKHEENDEIKIYHEKYKKIYPELYI